jgi:hypothetical protein
MLDYLLDIFSAILKFDKRSYLLNNSNTAQSSRQVDAIKGQALRGCLCFYTSTAIDEQI